MRQNTPSKPRAVLVLWGQGLAFVVVALSVFAVILGPFVAAVFLVPNSVWLGLSCAWIVVTFILMVAISAVYNP